MSLMAPESNWNRQTAPDHNVPTRKNPRLQDRLRPDTTIQVCYHDQGEEPRFIIGHWSIRSLAAPIRMMLSAAQVNHWIVMYDFKENDDPLAREWSEDSWLRDKEWLEQGYNCLISLPFLIDCRSNTVLVHVNAIMSFLGRELRLLGRSPPMTCRCEELLCEIMELTNLMIQFSSPEDDLMMAEEAKMLIEGPACRILDRLELVLKDAHPGVLDGVAPDEPEWNAKSKLICFLVGGSMTAPDFCLFEILDQFSALTLFFDFPDVVDGRPHLDAFILNFNNLEENQAFLQARACHLALPFNLPSCRFGSDNETQGGQYWKGQATPWRKLGVIKEYRMRIRPRKRQKTSRSRSQPSASEDHPSSHIA